MLVILKHLRMYSGIAHFTMKAQQDLTQWVVLLEH